MIAQPKIVHADSLPEDTSLTLPLLELAEILDLHKIWVESGGESGAKADLCSVNLANADLTGVNLQGAHLHKTNLRGADLSMANLRGASLVQADLRDTNLLGAELRGANLMGAMLYGAEGLWVGRLAGANLFDAILPESISAFDGAKAIAQATKTARWVYFLAMGVVAACCALILLTTDPRLLVNASAIPIPRSPNVLPLVGFYLGAPLLLLVLYLRLHFLLIRLWGSMAGLPAVFSDGQTPEKDGPWFLMGLIRSHFRWSREARSPLAPVEAGLATILAYWIVPVTLFFFWLRYLVRQDFRGTLLHIFLISASVAAAACLPAVVTRVLRHGEPLETKSETVARIVFSALRAALITAFALLLFSMGVIRGLPADRAVSPEIGRTDVRRWASQILQLTGYRPYADVTEAVLSPKLVEISADGSPETEGARLNQASLRYARAYRAFLAGARLWHADLDGAYFSEADLRGANLRDASLKNTVLDRISADHATFVSADAPGANFSSADLRSADLSYGTFEGADFSNAKLSAMSAYAADFKKARLIRADLSRGDLRDSKFDDATLALANLQEADFSSARIEKADFSGALLKSTIFLDADLANANLRGAALTGAILGNATLDGANLERADLRGALGLSPAQLCAATHWRGALLDADLAAGAQARCGNSQSAPFGPPAR